MAWPLVMGRDGPHSVGMLSFIGDNIALPTAAMAISEYKRRQNATLFRLYPQSSLKVSKTVQSKDEGVE